jgi:hypothetical protein
MPDHLYYNSIKFYLKSILLSIEESVKENNIEIINIWSEEIENNTIKLAQFTKFIHNPE